MTSNVRSQLIEDVGQQALLLLRGADEADPHLRNQRATVRDRRNATQLGKLAAIWLVARMIVPTIGFLQLW